MVKDGNRPIASKILAHHPVYISGLIAFSLVFFVCDLLGAPGQAVDPGIKADQARLREEIRMVLSDSRFHRGNFQWFKKILDFIGKWLGKWMRLMGGSRAENEFLGKILKILGIAFLICLPFLLIYFVFRFIQPGKKLGDRKLAEIERQARPEEFMNRAADLAGKSEYREAIRYLYLACLAGLKEQYVLPHGAERTDRENLKFLRGRWGGDSREYSGFSGLVRLFQEKWYGLMPCELYDYERALSFLDAIHPAGGKTDGKV
ncbi:MAG: hypothetical protein ACM3WV_03970 [Bacillota bacterium]